MCPSGSAIPYRELVAIADRLLEESDEDDEQFIRALDAVDPAVRRELLVSDLLNASQVFLYSFRTVPDELVRERMELEPASSLVQGLRIEEIDLMELIFTIQDGEPAILISDGQTTVATFTGRTAYRDAKASLIGQS